MVKREYYALFIMSCDDEFDANEGYTIFFPDFCNATCSDTESEGIKNAQELLELTIHGMHISNIPGARPKESLADIYVIEVPYQVKNGTISAIHIDKDSVSNTLIAHVALIHNIRCDKKKKSHVVVAELCCIDFCDFERSHERGFIDPIDVPKILHDEIQSYIDGKSQKIIHVFSDTKNCIKFISIPVFLQTDINGIVKFDSVIEFCP